VEGAEYPASPTPFTLKKLKVESSLWEPIFIILSTMQRHA
jgi:hypothetical protein